MGEIEFMCEIECFVCDMPVMCVFIRFFVGSEGRAFPGCVRELFRLAGSDCLVRHHGGGRES